MNILTSIIKVDLTAHINAAFYSFDTDFSGTISKEELSSAFKTTINDISDQEIDGIYQNMLFESEKTISWSSFLYSSLDADILNFDNLTKAFHFFCQTDSQQALTCEELKLSMIRRGQIFQAQAEENQIDQILEQAGIHHDCAHVLKHNEKVEVQHESEKHTTVLNIKQFCALMGIKGDGESSSEGGSPVVHSHHHHDHEESKEGGGHMSHGEEDEC